MLERNYEVPEYLSVLGIKMATTTPVWENWTTHLPSRDSYFTFSSLPHWYCLASGTCMWKLLGLLLLRTSKGKKNGLQQHAT